MRGLGSRLTNEQWMEFIKCVNDAGINTDPWWEAVPYAGPPVALRGGLFRKDGWLSRTLIVAASEPENLKTVMDYIRHNPECRMWELSCHTGFWQLSAGDFAIVQRNAFRGGDRQVVVSLLRRFGIEQYLIDHALDERPEETLGYVLSSSVEEANSLAEVVGIGAMTPISRQEQDAVMQAIIRQMATRNLSGRQR